MSRPTRTSVMRSETRRRAIRHGIGADLGSLEPDNQFLSQGLGKGWYSRPPMAAPIKVDVLVVGSGASGLAAAVSAERSGASVALVAKGALQSCNSAKAQGGIQAAFGEDDSPEQHAEDVWQSSHETADRSLVEVLTGEAPSAIHWLEELGVETRDYDALQYHPNGGAWPATMQGYSIPETTRAYGAVLLNADREEFTDSLGPRDAVSQAIFDEVEAGRGVETPDGRPAVY